VKRTRFLALATTSESLLAAVRDHRFAEALRTFDALAQPTAVDHYLAALTLMDLHRPDDADVRLRAAKAAGCVEPRGWTSVDALLERVRVVRELSPPRVDAAAFPSDASIVAFAGPPTAWSRPVLRALPEFAAVGREIFGKDAPTIRLYLFAERGAFDRFYAGLFGVEVPTAWQDGTGNTNVAVFCETDRAGKTTRPAGAAETVSCVLHEFGHAWFATYLMDRRDKDWLSPALRRPWLDEGLADCVAALREPDFLVRRAAWLRTKAAKGVAAPTFDEIATYAGFYEKGDVDVHYWISALFVADLLGPRDKSPATIRGILDEIGKSGDVETSVATATGKDLRKEFAKVVARFW
jgi:hypothetical protein